jgi:hypothetical protein
MRDWIRLDQARSGPPKVLESRRTKLCVANSMLNRLVPHPVLDVARIVPRIRQGVAAGVPQHVNMHREG